MSTTLAQLVAEVPKLYESGDQSTASILKDIGYFEARESILVEDVEDSLKREPELADMWLDRGNDQRLTGGWGIDVLDGEYRIQNYADGNCLSAQDRSHACAEFAVRYVGFIAEVVSRAS